MSIPGALSVFVTLGLIFISVSPPLPVVMVTPSVPTAGVAFTLSGITPNPGSLTVYRNEECSGVYFLARGVGPGQYTILVPGQPAGQYSAEQSGSACVPFKITSVVGSR